MQPLPDSVPHDDFVESSSLKDNRKDAFVTHNYWPDPVSLFHDTEHTEDQCTRTVMFHLLLPLHINSLQIRYHTAPISILVRTFKLETKGVKLLNFMEAEAIRSFQNWLCQGHEPSLATALCETLCNQVLLPPNAVKYAQLQMFHAFLLQIDASSTTKGVEKYCAADTRHNAQPRSSCCNADVARQIPTTHSKVKCTKSTFIGWDWQTSRCTSRQVTEMTSLHAKCSWLL